MAQSLNSSAMAKFESWGMARHQTLDIRHQTFLRSQWLEGCDLRLSQYFGMDRR